MATKRDKMNSIREAFEGTGLSHQQCIVHLEGFIREDEATVSIHEQFPGFVMDGKLAFDQAVDEIVGWSETAMAEKQTMMGKMKVPSTEVSVEVEYGVYKTIQWGGVVIPGVDGELQCSTGGFDGMPCFVLAGTIKKKSLPLVKQICDRGRQILLTGSIYKGKAIVLEPKRDPNDGEFKVTQEPPSFFKLNGLVEDDLVLPESTRRDVSTAVFGMIEDAEQLSKMGLKTKRTVVLDGEPGTGKTHTMTICAGVAVKHGWTFVLNKDVRFLGDAIKIVHKYNLSPAVISSEDIDRVMFERDDEANKLLNAIDGVDSKSLNVSFLLTTNHADRIIETFQRAGRSDWIIRFPMPDADAASQLLMKYATKHGLVHFDLEPEEFLEVGKMLAESRTLPANISEVVERALRYKVHEGQKVIDVRMLMDAAVNVVTEKSRKLMVVAQSEGIVERIAKKLEVA